MVALGLVALAAVVDVADLEDALSPTWANIVGGQAALIDAVVELADLTGLQGTALEYTLKVPMLMRPMAVTGSPLSLASASKAAALVSGTGTLTYRARPDGSSSRRAATGSAGAVRSRACTARSGDRS